MVNHPRQIIVHGSIVIELELRELLTQLLEAKAFAVGRDFVAFFFKQLLIQQKQDVKQIGARIIYNMGFIEIFYIK